MQKRPGAPLVSKLLRDLKNGWKSFFSILIICMLAVTLYAGIDATWRCIDRELNRQFAQSSVADLWVRGEVSDRTIRDLRAIEGVEIAQRRTAVEFNADDLATQPKLMLIMNDGDPAVCKPLVREGTLPVKANECMVSQRFGEAHGLMVGDPLRVTMGDRVLTLSITGFGFLPEYVVTSDGNELSPSPLQNGYAWVAPGTLSFLPYTEAALTLKPGASITSVRAAVEGLMKEQQVVLIGRSDVFGIKMALEQAQQIRAMGAIFPLVFFIVAALITWTTMNRLVESQRLQIGSLFALGYTRRELTLHYASYGFLIAILGALTGLAGARYGIGPVLMSFINAAYALPDAVPVLSPWVTLGVSLVLAAITGGASILSARAAFRQSPAALLRPKPPGKGKRIFLENIRGLWNLTPFSEKMILRNMLRNPIRLLMGLIGALGCTALILVGFGLRDTVDYVLANHYTRTMHYDARATLKDDTPVDYAGSVALRADAQSYEEEMITSAEVLVQGEWRSKQVYVLTNGHEMIRLYDAGGNSVHLDDDGIALTRKAADDFALGLGDTIWLRAPGGRGVSSKVAHILDLQLDQGVYMARSVWEKLDLSPWRPTAALLRGDRLNLDAAQDMEGVDKERTLNEERATSGTTLNIMNTIVLLLVLFAGVLELMVFYNLGQLNFAERIRELATLKVLGFMPGEIRKLVLRENVIITLLGLPLGLAAGPFLLQVLLDYGLSNTIQFVSHIGWTCWVYTAVLALTFTFVVNWLLGSRFKQVNMVEALKSVE